jgi:hypothetical protein
MVNGASPHLVNGSIEIVEVKITLRARIVG